MTGPGYTPEVAAAHDAMLEVEDEQPTYDERKDAEDYWAEKVYDAMKDAGRV